MRWQICSYLLTICLQSLIGAEHWETFSFQFVMNKEQNGRKCEHTCWHVLDNPVLRKMHSLRYVGPPLKSLKLLKEWGFCFCLNRTKPFDKYKNQCMNGCKRRVLTWQCEIRIYLHISFILVSKYCFSNAPWPFPF